MKNNSNQSIKPKKACICGVFDLLHCGHIFLFKDAKRHCNYLLVAIEDDPTIRRKEKHKPVLTLKERVNLVAAIRYVDEVVTYTTEEELLKILEQPDITMQIMGLDHKGQYFTGNHLPHEIYYHNRDHNLSTSNIRKCWNKKRG